MKKKLPTPKKLHSGSWRCQVMVDGKRVSVVAPTPGEAQAKAVAIKGGLIEAKKSVKKAGLTLGQAIDRYIESKNNVLSPGTVRGYIKIRENRFQDIIDTDIDGLTQEAIQRSVNIMALKLAPKSIKSAHGLLSATLKVYRPEFVLRTTLPAKRKTEIKIPTNDEMKKLVEAAAGTDFELPLLLGFWVGLRRSEIVGLTWDCLEGNVLHVKEAVVYGINGPTTKGTKTYSGDRKIIISDYLRDLINAQPKTDEHIIHLSGQAIYERFSRLCERVGVPHYRFHDLRHYNASVMLALNVPDKYSTERIGHATDNMLKTVYQHIMPSKREEVAGALDGYVLQEVFGVAGNDAGKEG